MFNVQEQKYVPLSTHLAKQQFFLLSQGCNTVGEYYEQFKNQTDVLSHISAGIGDDKATMKQVLHSRGIDVSEATEAQEETAELEGIQWYLALAFLMGFDQSRYGRLLEKLENDFTTGNDNYPKTLTDAYNMLLNGRMTLAFSSEWQGMMEFPLPPTPARQTKNRTLTQKTLITKRPLQHTSIRPWAKKAGVMVVVMVVDVEAVAAPMTTFNASGVGQWAIMPLNALKPLRTCNECWRKTIKQELICYSTQ